jgi:hypothetical protein
MAKIIVESYSFDASAKQITFSTYSAISIERVLLVVNITDNVIIYNFSNPSLGGTAATNVLTLTYNTTTMDDADKLMVFYDDPKPATATHTNVAGSASNVTLLAANKNRVGATIYNDSSATLYLKLGATASATSFTAKLGLDDYFEIPYGYVGVIDGIWSAASGSARIVEVT